MIHAVCPRINGRTLVAAAALAVLGLLPGQPAAAQGGPPPVTVAPVVVRDVVEQDEYTGQFAAVDAVDLRARVSGYLTEIHFTDGQLVNKGDLLFVIDPRPYEAALASAKAQVASNQAKVDLANRQLTRTGALAARDFAAQSTFDERTADMREAVAATEAARAAQRSAELDLEFTHITAPIGGRIGAHQVSVGNLVNGGSGGTSTLLASIVSLNPIYFVYDMSEADYLGYQRAIAKGEVLLTRDRKIPIQVRLSDEKSFDHDGVLDFIDNQLDRGAGTIRARAALPNPGNFIAPGMFGRIRQPASDRYKAVLVPDSAVLTDQSRRMVLTVAADGTVEPKVVRPGPMIDGLRVVRSGLAEGDRIIIDGLMRARPGAKVTPQPGTIVADTQG